MRFAAGFGGSDMKGPNRQSGFTFVELMAVVAIVGILACVMLPGVKNYVARAKVTEAIQAMTACRTPVSEIFQTNSPGQPFPDEWGCEKKSGTASQYVDSIEVNDGVIRILTSAAMRDLRIAPYHITLAPLTRSGYVMTVDDQGERVFRWRCGSTLDGTDPGLDFSLMPSSCRGF